MSLEEDEDEDEELQFAVMTPYLCLGLDLTLIVALLCWFNRLRADYNGI
jgi:hypothetical protein